jgi:hypothetical protein
MGAAEQGRQGLKAQRLSSAITWPCVASIAGTMIGETLGSTLPEKLLAGMLGAIVSAILTTSGTRTHHRRRIVAVALLVGLLEMLRRAKRALASSTLYHQHRPPHHPHGRPAVNWPAACLAAVTGFGLGSLGTTALDGWAQASNTKTVAVPELTRTSEVVALRSLRQARLAPIKVSESSASIAKGSVKRTSPPAGAPVPVRSEVKLVVSSGQPQTLPSNDNPGRLGFRSPSGNIRCVMVAVGLPDGAGKEVGRVALLGCASQEPPQSVALGADGGARVCNGQDCFFGMLPRMSYVPARILGYGESDRFGPFRCTSFKRWIRCTAIPSGDGFTISKQGVDADQLSTTRP